MSPTHYQQLIAYATALLKRNHFFGDPLDIVHDAYLINPNPGNEHVKKAFWQHYEATIEYAQFRKKPSVEKTRICNHCKEELPTAAFTRNRGIRHTCDRCINIYNRRWNAKNLKKRRASGLKSYYKNKHKERFRYDSKKYQEWRKSNPQKVKLKNARIQLKRKISGRR